jgi:MFS transporter, DHA1 family, multidrug resistance protein
MSDLIRDAPIGQIIRYLTKNRLLKYPEELDTWQCPHSYDENAAATGIKDSIQLDEATREHVAEPHEPVIKEEAEPKEEIENAQEEVADFSSSDGEDVENAAMEKIATHKEDDYGHLEHIRTVRTTAGIERVGTRSALTQSKTRGELEEAFRLSTLEGGPSRPVIPATLDDGTILVDWYTTDDQE